MQKILSALATLAGGVVVVVVLFNLADFDQPLTGEVLVEINVPQDDTLTGAYTPGEQPYGVLLMAGFGSDQTALRPLTSEFVKAGLHVFTFDFSGHGRSPGGLDFNNASTERLANQVLAAEAKFRQLSGLTADQIIFLGHSMGARVSLQASTMMTTPPMLLLLLGTSVNLAPNQQAEIFTQTQDSDLAWVQALGPENPNTDIILISGEWDDVLKPEGARLMVEKLSGTALESQNRVVNVQTDPVRTLILVPKLLHNFEIYSIIPQLGITEAIGSADPSSQPNQYNQRVTDWLYGLGGLFLALFAARGVINKQEANPPEAVIESLGAYFRGKLLSWFPALIPGALIGLAVLFAPMNSPAFNLHYIVFFGGYGLVLWWRYRREKMPGVEGKMNFKGYASPTVKNTVLAGLVFLLVLGSISLMARSGWWYAFPLNHRFLWLLLFTPVTAIGFRIGFKEADMLRDWHPDQFWLVWLNGLIGLLPFFLYPAILAALGSTSGVLVGVQGLVVIALAMLTGSLIHKISKRPWLAAMCQAFLLYWMVLPLGALFR